MALLAGLVFIVYSICIVLIGLYCLSQLYLLYSYLRFWKNKKISIPPAELDDNLPAITIQLPIYNEKYVVERLIDSITALQYPISKLQIQILDDSDDDTIEIWNGNCKI
jgi:cellulose synthase/poly-beta-1,6-N-acetylglucosamine synthase-like glycosyltransferase